RSVKTSSRGSKGSQLNPRSTCSVRPSGTWRDSEIWRPRLTGSTRRESLLKWAEKRRLDYVARHGSMPLCACGCGREVAICTSSGKPNKLYERSCQQRARSMAASGKLKWIIAEAEGDLIPIDRFREIV